MTSPTSPTAGMQPMTHQEYRSFVRDNINLLVKTHLDEAIAILVLGFVWVYVPADLFFCVAPVAKAKRLLSQPHGWRLSASRPINRDIHPSWMPHVEPKPMDEADARYIETIITAMNDRHGCACRIFAGAALGQPVSYLAQFSKYGDADQTPSVSHPDARYAVARAALQAIFYYEEQQP